MAISFQIIREGRDYWTTADGGPRFFVGRQVTYQGRVGLTNVFPGTPLPRLDYDPKTMRNVSAFGRPSSTRRWGVRGGIS